MIKNEMQLLNDTKMDGQKAFALSSVEDNQQLEQSNEGENGVEFSQLQPSMFLDEKVTESVNSND